VHFLTFGCHSVTLCHSVTHAMCVTIVTYATLVTTIINDSWDMCHVSFVIKWVICRLLVINFNKVRCVGGSKSAFKAFGRQFCCRPKAKTYDPRLIAHFLLFQSNSKPTGTHRRVTRLQTTRLFKICHTFRRRVDVV
jgi:hypothetical protein